MSTALCRAAGADSVVFEALGAGEVGPSGRELGTPPDLSVLGVLARRRERAMFSIGDGCDWSMTRMCSRSRVAAAHTSILQL